MSFLSMAALRLAMPPDRRNTLAYWARFGFVFVVVPVLLLAGTFSCVFADCIWELRVRGVGLDRDSGAPLSDAVLGSRTFTGGVETFFVPPFASPNASVGTFEFEVAYELFPCNGSPRPFPHPDRLELIVVRGACEQSVFIDLSDQTVIDIEFPNDVIELKDPILVPPCAP